MYETVCKLARQNSSEHILKINVVDSFIYTHILKKICLE